MNIAPVINTPKYRNSTSFGMAFKKPSPEVSALFTKVLRDKSPVEREAFVKAVGALVERAKSCPENIEHKLVPGYIAHYGAKVGDNLITHKSMVLKNTGESILDIMNKAVNYAENLHNLKENNETLMKILG